MCFRFARFGQSVQVLKVLSLVILSVSLTAYIYPLLLKKYYFIFSCLSVSWNIFYKQNKKCKTFLQRFYFITEHFVFLLGFQGASRLCFISIVYTFLWKTITSKQFVDFQNLMKIEFCWMLIFKVLITLYLPWAHVRSNTRFEARSVQPFWRLLDTDTQTSKVYIL